MIEWSSDAISTDDVRVGPYAQPAWTTQRPFAQSRVYVLPPGQAQVEQWVRPTWVRGEKTEFRMLEEFAIGLPGRFQLDLYERWNIEPVLGQQQANHEGVQIELRYAFADWGVIPFNPTLYAEWVERGGPQDKPNKYELKLLLAEELSPRLFFASNLILEQEVREDRETELAWSMALSTPIIQRKLMAGIETRGASFTTHGNRSDPSYEFLVGPEPAVPAHQPHVSRCSRAVGHDQRVAVVPGLLHLRLPVRHSRRPVAKHQRPGFDTRKLGTLI